MESVLAAAVTGVLTLLGVFVANIDLNMGAYVMDPVQGAMCVVFCMAVLLLVLLRSARTIT